MVSAQKSENQDAPAGEVAPAIEWGKIDSPQDARIALEKAGVPILTSAVLFGDGADFIKDKNLLCGVPFIILDFHFIIDPETGREYVNVLVMNQEGNKARFNDGSSGVCAQLKKVKEEYGAAIGISVKFGLRKSSYKTPDGEAATTFYLSA